jgi:hypothetical protein
MSAWLKLDPADFVAFVAASLLGYFAGTLAPDSMWAIYISILISYHLFLLWLVLSGERKAGIALTPFSTLVTHLACLIVIAPVGLARNLPIFAAFRFGIAGFAVFERAWLFSASHAQPRREQATTSPIAHSATAEDFEAWCQYLAQRKATQRKAGMSVREEYERWLHARSRKRHA